ncbi:MAG: hypothetical protein MZV70_74350 [Desulfobacterales bacterium]|nr:hypothetical protein [Desulfobacterales bacterium]
MSAVKGRQLLSTQEGVAVMLFIAGVLAKEDDTQFAASSGSVAVMERDYSAILRISGPSLRKSFPDLSGLMAVSCAIELLRGKLPATILDIWQDEAQAFFSEGGADVDGFSSAGCSTSRFSVKVPEAEDSENIKVDTIHGTKGLQFKHVFIFWNEEERESPFYLESEKCHVQFSSKEIDFLDVQANRQLPEKLLENHEKIWRGCAGEGKCFLCRRDKGDTNTDCFSADKKRRETTSPFIRQCLIHFRSLRRMAVKRRYLLFVRPCKRSCNAMTIFNVPEKHNDEPEKYGEIDPALISAYIKAGIMRGDRLHRWLAKVVDQTELPPPES